MNIFIPAVKVEKKRTPKLDENGNPILRKKNSKPKVANIERISRAMFERECKNIHGSDLLNQKIIEYGQVNTAFRLAIIDNAGETEINRLDAVRSQLQAEINILRKNDLSMLGPMITKVRRMLKVYAKRNDRDTFKAACEAVAMFFPDRDNVEDFWATIDADTTEA